MIAMPQPMVDELDWPDSDLTWNDVAKLSAADDVWAEHDRPNWGPFRLHLVEDVASEPSITAVAALTRAVGALPDADEQTDTSDAQQFEARAQLLLLERRIGYLGDDTGSQLDRLRTLDRRDELLTTVSALPLTEQMVWQYNGGRRDANPPPTPLAAWYPEDGGPDADYPYVQLDASWASSETDVAAAALLDALTSQDGIGRLRAHGFRNGARETTAELIEAAGLRPELAPPEPDRLPAQIVRPILQAWRGLSQTGKPARRRRRVRFDGDAGAGDRRDPPRTVGAGTRGGHRADRPRELGRPVGVLDEPRRRHRPPHPGTDRAPRRGGRVGRHPPGGPDRRHPGPRATRRHRPVRHDRGELRVPARQLRARHPQRGHLLHRRQERRR
ncbi:MAG: substrate-binding domain-containing protein [Actinobacteria bacterium]|nr:substrate-binding domain-containing protein [Actinomycetota bacterium]